MKVIIPAAGYATRLGELTENKPKHLLEIGGKPMINHVMKGVSTLPCHEVFLVTNNKFYSHFLEWRKGFQTSLNIEILNDGTLSNKDRMGTVGDIYYAVRDRGIRDDLFIIAGDNLYYQKGAGYFLKPLYDVFKELGGGAGVLGLCDVDSLDTAKQLNQVTFSGNRIPPINEKSEIVKIVEKEQNPDSTLVAGMIEIYPLSIIDHLKEYLEASQDHDRMGDFRAWILKERKLPIFGYHLSGQWFDIGLPEQLEEARRFYEDLRQEDV